MTLQFDRDDLIRRVSSVSESARALFAICCAERMYGLYLLYCQATGFGNSSLVRKTLDSLWESVTAEPKQRVLFAAYNTLMPNEANKRTLYDALAENAIPAVAYACETRNDGNPDKAVWAAFQPYEAVDYLAQRLFDINTSDHATEMKLLSLPFVQEELQRTYELLASIEQLGPHDLSSRSTIANFRQSSADASDRLLSVAKSVKLC